MRQWQAMSVMSLRIMTAKTPGDRIKAMREQLGWSQSELSRRAGVPQQTIGSIETKGTRQPRQALELAKALGVTVEWLLRGEGPLPEVLSPPAQILPQGKQIMREKLHFYNERQLLAGEETETLVDMVEVGLREGELTNEGDEMSPTSVAKWRMPADFVRTHLEAEPSQVVVLEVGDDSMSPTLVPGDKVVVDVTVRNPATSGLYALQEGGQIVILRLQPIRGSAPAQVKVIYDNKSYDVETANINKLNILGRVRGRISKL